MKDSLKPGLKTTRRFVVDESRVITFLGDGGGSGGDGRVYATPSLIRDIEQTCRDYLLEHIDEGEDSLGTLVNVQHIAPTLLGMWADVSIEVASVDGRAVTFNVRVGDAVDDTVAKGQHSRFVVGVDKVKERLADKAARAKEAS